jgi:hypothetical protein
MNKRAAAKAWYLPWRAQDARRPDDPAELGTAFGLDMTLQAEAAEREAAALPVRRPGWLQRLSIRRRSAT